MNIIRCKALGRQVRGMLARGDDLVTVIDFLYTLDDIRVHDILELLTFVGVSYLYLQATMREYFGIEV